MAFARRQNKALREAEEFPTLHQALQSLKGAGPDGKTITEISQSLDYYPMGLYEELNRLAIAWVLECKRGEDGCHRFKLHPTLRH